MTLTGRFFAALGFIQVVGILVAWQAIFLLPYLLLLAALLLFAWRDLAGFAGAGDYRLSVEGPKNPRLGQAGVFRLSFELLGARAQSTTLRALALASPLFSFRVPATKLEGSDPLVLEVDVLRLGYMQVDRWPVALSSKHGFFRRVLPLPLAPIELRVAPERAVLNEEKFVEILRSQPLFRHGARILMRSSAQDQVHSIRRYQYPDPLRHIDQKKMARFGEPMTRTFDSLRSHHLIIALDIGRAMAGEIRGSAKIDYYLSAALALAENALRSHDEVSLFAFAQGRKFLIRRTRSLEPFQPIFCAQKVFSPATKRATIPIAREVRQISGSRAIVLVLTDSSKPSVQEGLLRALGPLCRKHLAVVFGLSDAEIDLEENVLAFAEPARPEDFQERYSSLLYSYWMREKHALFQEKLARLGAGSLVVQDAYWITTVERLYGLLRASLLA